MSPSPTRGAPRRGPVGALGEGNSPRATMATQLVGRLDVVQLQPARRPGAAQVRLARDDRDGRPSRTTGTASSRTAYVPNQRGSRERWIATSLSAAPAAVAGPPGPVVPTTSS